MWKRGDFSFEVGTVGTCTGTGLRGRTFGRSAVRWLGSLLRGRPIDIRSGQSPRNGFETSVVLSLVGQLQM